MKGKTLLKAVLLMSVVAMLAPPVLAQPPASGQRRGMYMYGDWRLRTEINGIRMSPILSFSRDEEGNRIAYMINLFSGMTKLQDLKYENGELSFVWVNPIRRNDSISTFKGKIEEGKLTGMLTSDRGESKVTGERAPRMSRAVGIWNMQMKMGDREFTSKLAITQNEEGELVGKWEGQRSGETEVTDLTYERGAVTFKRTGTYNGIKHQYSFEGTIDRETDTLSGTIKSDRGVLTVTGTRVGAPVIGTWILELNGLVLGGPRRQRLVVNGDMTGLYGAIPIKQVSFEDGKVSFQIVVGPNNFKIELNFACKIDDEGKLTGEMTTRRGTSKITGKKAPSFFERRPGN